MSCAECGTYQPGAAVARHPGVVRKLKGARREPEPAPSPASAGSCVTLPGMFTTAQCQKPLTVGASGFIVDAAIDASAMAAPSTAGARFGFCRLATTRSWCSMLPRPTEIQP